MEDRPGRLRGLHEVRIPLSKAKEWACGPEAPAGWWWWWRRRSGAVFTSVRDTLKYMDTIGTYFMVMVVVREI